MAAAPAYLRRRGEPKTPEAFAKHDALSWFADPMDTRLVGREHETRIRLNVVFRSNAPSALRALAIDAIGSAMLPT